MKSEILIIDIETTGFLSCGGKICEIGVVSLCLDSGNKEIVFDKIINPLVDDDALRKSWIVKNNYMTIEDIKNGVIFDNIKEELQVLINKHPNGATAYNINFDFDFLRNYGITFPKKLACPMHESTNICKIPRASGWGYKWPTAEEAYKHFNPGVEYKELHRGADDAFHEADIVYKLHLLRNKK